MKNEREEILELARYADKILNNAERNQNKTIKNLIHILAPTNSQRQKKFTERRKAAGYKKLNVWAKNDPKYKFSGADIHIGNIGICAKDKKALIAFEYILQYLESEGSSPELIEDITCLLKVFGFERQPLPPIGK